MQICGSKWLAKSQLQRFGQSTVAHLLRPGGAEGSSVDLELAWQRPLLGKGRAWNRHKVLDRQLRHPRTPTKVTTQADCCNWPHERPMPQGSSPELVKSLLVDLSGSERLKDQGLIVRDPAVHGLRCLNLQLLRSRLLSFLALLPCITTLQLL